jgi:sn-2 palmitoyl-lipid 9-desaturase
MGEAWHDNHHAFSRLGTDDPDPGWWVVCMLSRLGLVWGVKTPEQLPLRPNLVSLGTATDRQKC